MRKIKANHEKYYGNLWRDNKVVGRNGVKFMEILNVKV